MATIRKRGKSFQCIVRKNGHSITRSFSTKKLAELYAKETELHIEKGIFRDTSESEKITLSELFDLYSLTILPHKKGKEVEAYRIIRLKKELGGFQLSQLSNSILTKYTKNRLKDVSSGSIKRELTILRSVLTSATKDFGINLPHGNPVSQIRIPKENKPRDRRLKENELQKLKCHSNQFMECIITIAVETGIRRGELCKTFYKDITWDRQTLLLRDTKNGNNREIPLTNEAISAFKELIKLNPECISNEGTIIKVQPGCISKKFLKLCKKAGLSDLRLHDLRHEATSRFFEKGLNTMEVSAITGHNDLTMLKRYTHINPVKLLEKLQGQ